jgi:hypothetical protein
MKGGSMTKIICETIGTIAAALAWGSSSSPSSERLKAVSSNPSLLHSVIRDVFLQYETTVRHAYSTAASGGRLARLISDVGTSLTTDVPLERELPTSATTADRLLISPTGNGRLIYLGVGTAGLLALIDASECNPTYGALFNSVRCFVSGGWSTIANKQGPMTDMIVPKHMRGDQLLPSFLVPEFVNLGLESFTSDFVPTLTPADTVVLVYAEEPQYSKDDDAGPRHLSEAIAALDLAKAAGAKVNFIAVVSATPASVHTAHASRGVDVLRAIRAVVQDPSAGVVVTLPSVKIRLNQPLTASPEDFFFNHAAAVTGATGSAESASSLFDPSGRDTILAPSFLAELACKLMLNAGTVGGHIFKGTIFRNRMINVTLTNAKLFHRGVGIVADTAGVDRDTALVSVLRAVYHKDDTAGVTSSVLSHLQPGAPAAAAASPSSFVTLKDTAEMSLLEIAQRLPVSNHVHNAYNQKMVVPVAILLAADELSRRNKKERNPAAVLTPAPTEAQAVATLRKQPILRLALLEALKQ